MYLHRAKYHNITISEMAHYNWHLHLDFNYLLLSNVSLKVSALLLKVYDNIINSL